MSKKQETKMKLYVGLMNLFGNRVPCLKNLATILDKGYYDEMIGSPGIITENTEGAHNVYGLSNPFEILDTYVRKLKHFDYGALESPEKLFSLLEEDRRGEKVINGCLIWIPSDRDESKVKKIIISPDNDLREKYGEFFNENLVESLDRTVSSYIEREGLSGQIIPAIQTKTLMMDGSPFSMRYWNRK